MNKKIKDNFVRFIPVFLFVALLVLTGCATTVDQVKDDEQQKEVLGSMVSTEYGQLLGQDDDENTWSWKGIPFAKPPVGELRWKAPEDPEPWSGIKDASEFSNIGVQYDGNLAEGQKVIGSEDCLYLNIWRPRSQERDLPVYFWIHGGGNTIGSARDNEGMSIAGRGNMIVVTVQYRLGPFGWFTHPDMRTGGNELDNSGNYGTLDIIKALEWVQKNISAFGGDPDNVTVAGESAGGLNVFTMIISPLSRGLFNKAMIQSGDFWTTTMADADKDGTKVLETMLKADELSEVPGNDVASYLRSKSAEEIMSIYTPGAAGLIDQRLGAYLDGRVLPESGIAVLSDPSGYNQVPMIIGANKDERKLFNFFFFTEENAEAYQAEMETLSAEWIRNGVDRPVSMMSENAGQPPIYVYQFNYGSYDKGGYNPWPTEQLAIQFGSCHALDMPFFWNDFPYAPYFAPLFREDNAAGYKDLSDAMMSYVAQFVHNGDPGSVNGQVWQAWNTKAGSSRRILFNADSDTAKIEMNNE